MDEPGLRVPAGNSRLAPGQAATIVAFHDAKSAAGRVLGTVSLPPMAPDATVNVALSNVDAQGLGDDVFATIDEVDAVAECAESNNGVHARVLHLRATDRSGLFDRQVVTASMLEVNDAPVFEVTTPPTPHVGHGFIHQLRASDVDVGDGLIYSLVSGPTGMSITPVSREHRRAPTASRRRPRDRRGRPAARCSG